MRPKYIQLYEKAVKQHMVGFIIKFEQRSLEEQRARENLWRDPKELAEFRELLRFMLKEENIERDDFF